MPKSYFQFELFRINQDKSGMKVCTDSCLFGAWTANKIERKILEPKTILDIGSGTGLLSLMIAQKSNSKIDAVEIDENSFLQTKENFMASPWNQRLQAFHADVKNWQGDSKYDLIVSNPPFFENDLKSQNKHKNLAKHYDGLTFTELVQTATARLASNGNFAVLLPSHRINYFKTIAEENNLYLNEELLLKQSSRHSVFRGILFFGTKKKPLMSGELIIKNTAGNYTGEFNYFLKDYYLATT